ncbi:precorrin-8X methylmutase [Desulfovibrio litoralis]|uniref:Precorrin-8X methylmutase n=1 Tax=Desulfovibrio litoralis DSM 11393 TaxID=1121455 RepID=A0A1M7S5U4_9BACT|nr:precorrin-8X methylmutase [Desulfovibrio litoralis]SHN53821.1 precorrin-8X methylmutase [Desulfovibrio litoralis DSM 11393]
MMKFQPFTTPSSIEEASFAIIDSEVNPKPFQGAAWEIARRLIHSTADFDILNHLELPDLAIKAGINALKSACIIYTDTEMAKVGMSRFRLDRLNVKVESILSLPQVVERAKELNSTRSCAAVELAWQKTQIEKNQNVIWAIGNAPTALIRLVELINETSEDNLPRLIIGLPVGFVNASESKEFLCKQNKVPYLTLKGRKGGSTLAAATVNALAELALRG